MDSNLIDVSNKIRIELHRNVYNNSMYIERLVQLIKGIPNVNVESSPNTKTIAITSPDKNFINNDYIVFYSILNDPVKSFILEMRNLLSVEVNEILDEFLLNSNNVSMLYDILFIKKQIILQL